MRITLPFVMSGLLNLRTAFDGPTLFSSPVHGAGRFSLTLTNLGGFYADPRDLGTFAFERQAPALTPEPPPALLLVMPMAILAFWLARRRQSPLS